MPNDDPGVTLVSLLLADFANIREGLLNVVSAGVTRIAAAEMPASFPLHLALMASIRPDRIEQVHEATITFNYPERAQQIAKASLHWAAAADRNPGESLNMPMVLPLHPIVFTERGQVDVNVSINGQSVGSLSFWLVPPPQHPAA